MGGGGDDDAGLLGGTAASLQPNWLWAPESFSLPHSSNPKQGDDGSLPPKPPAWLAFFFFSALFLLSHLKGFASHSREINLKKKKKMCWMHPWMEEERNDSLTLLHTPPRHPTALKRLFFLRQPHSVAIPGLCGRRLLCACVCPPGRLQPSVNERYRWLEHKCVTSGLVLESSLFPASIVSLGTDLFRGSILV